MPTQSTVLTEGGENDIVYSKGTVQKKEQVQQHEKNNYNAACPCLLPNKSHRISMSGVPRPGTGDQLRSAGIRTLKASNRPVSACVVNFQRDRICTDKSRCAVTVMV